MAVATFAVPRQALTTDDTSPRHNPPKSRTRRRTARQVRRDTEKAWAMRTSEKSMLDDIETLSETPEQRRHRLGRQVAYRKNRPDVRTKPSWWSHAFGRHHAHADVVVRRRREDERFVTKVEILTALAADSVPEQDDDSPTHRGATLYSTGVEFRGTPLSTAFTQAAQKARSRIPTRSADEGRAGGVILSSLDELMDVGGFSLCG
ncbi:MAG TPA: hypothetical protein VHD60_01665 [Candidatus Saccharimonadales bacterium]|nr:hypothetical protein [Candidatus Saccharimonadales bacterium]